MLTASLQHSVHYSTALAITLGRYLYTDNFRLHLYNLQSCNPILLHQEICSLYASCTSFLYCLVKCHVSRRTRLVYCRCRIHNHGPSVRNLCDSSLLHTFSRSSNKAQTHPSCVTGTFELFRSDPWLVFVGSVQQHWNVIIIACFSSEDGDGMYEDLFFSQVACRDVVFVVMDLWVA